MIKIIRKGLKTRLLFLSSIFILLLGSCQQNSDGYTIKGNISGVESGWIKLIEYNIADRDAAPVIIDSTEIINGRFEFSGRVEYADQVNMRIADEYYSSFILENCKITLDLELSKDENGRPTVNTTVSGSLLNDELKKADEEIDKIFHNEKYAILDEIREESIKAYRSEDPELIQKAQDRSNQYTELADERFYNYKKAKMDWVRTNPASAIAPYVLSVYFSEGRMTREEMKEIYPLFEGAATKTAMYKWYSKTYEEIFEKLGEGSPAPDFTLPAYKNGTITLSEVEGKYIFLDFWASWCNPCRSSFPHLKKVYDKYHKDGFEVLGIGTADAGAAWKAAIEEDQTPWIHVFDGDPDAEGKARGAYGEVSKLYGVPFLPTTFLLDSEGNIIGRQLRGIDLDKKLQELFGY